MTAVTHHFDLIVLGTDLAGLVAAALVARRGRRALVIPGGPVTGRLRHGPHDLSLAPAPVPTLDDPSSAKVFQELGLGTQIRREYAPFAAPFHCAVGRARVDVRPGRGDPLTPWTRAWPRREVAELAARHGACAARSDEAIEELLAAAASARTDGIWSRRAVQRARERLPQERDDPCAGLDPADELGGAWALPIPWAVDLDPAQLGLAARTWAAAGWLPAPRVALRGGGPRLREILLQRIELHAGEVRPDVRADQILLRRGKVAGVTLLGKPTRFGADHLVIATDPRRLLHGPLPPELCPRPLLASMDLLQTVATRYVMELEVDPRGLSPVLDGLVLYAPPGATADPHGRGKTLILARRPDDGPARLTVSRILPAGADTGGLREQLLDELDEAGILPFIHDHVRTCLSPHDGRPPTDGRGRPTDEADRLPPPPRLPMEELVGLRDARPLLGMGLLPIASGIKNLHLAGALFLPGLGLAGQIAAGFAAANQVAPPGRTSLSRTPLLRRA